MGDGAPGPGFPNAESFSTAAREGTGCGVLKGEMAESRHCCLISLARRKYQVQRDPIAMRTIPPTIPPMMGPVDVTSGITEDDVVVGKVDDVVEGAIEVNPGVIADDGETARKST